MSFRALLLAAAAVLPLAFAPRVARAPLSRIPCEVASPGCTGGDPTIAVAVMGRTWDRWDRGDFAIHDDRVFAPYPDSWALGEGYLLPALISYPAVRLTGSLPLGFNLPFYLACAATLVASGALFARIAGPGLPALLAAVLFTWGPARLNNLGVLPILWAGLVALALLFGLRFLERGRARDALLLAAAWIAVGLGTLYGLVMGAIVAAIVFLLAARGTRGARRLALLALASASAAALLAIPFRPYFSLGEEFGAKVDPRLMEAQSADLLSILHGGALSGVTGRALEALFPFFPQGTSALFPTLTFLFALVAAAAFRLRGRARLPERRPLLWLAVAAASLLFALGPTIHAAGRPVAPGPWRLVAGLPAFNGLRGLFRWDQWFDLGIAAAAAILLSAALRRARGARRGATLFAAALLVALDVWPRAVPAETLPPPSPFTGNYRALPESAIVAVYPFDRETSERAWIEQLAHGRRVVNGFQTFPPPITYWAWSRLRNGSAAEAVAIYRELGSSAVEARLSDLPPARAAELRDALRATAKRVLERDGRVVGLYDPKEPVLVDPARLEGLRFAGGSAVVARAPGRLLFRLGGGTRNVLLRTGGRSAHGVLAIPTVGAGVLRASLEEPPPPGAEVIDARSGRVIGRSVP